MKTHLNPMKLALVFAAIWIPIVGCVILVINVGWWFPFVVLGFGCFGMFIMGLTLVIVMAVERAAATQAIQRQRAAKHRRGIR